MSPHRPKEKVLPGALAPLGAGPGAVDAQAARPRAIVKTSGTKGRVQNNMKKVFEIMQGPSKDV